MLISIFCRKKDIFQEPENSTSILLSFIIGAWKVWTLNQKIVNNMSLSKNKEFCFSPGCKHRNRELKLTCEDCKLAKYCTIECQDSHFVDHMQFCAPAKSMRETAMKEEELLKVS